MPPRISSSPQADDINETTWGEIDETGADTLVRRFLDIEIERMCGQLKRKYGTTHKKQWQCTYLAKFPIAKNRMFNCQLSSCI